MEAVYGVAPGVLALLVLAAALAGWVDAVSGGGGLVQLPALLVGQFNQGKIRVFNHLGGQQFGPGKWLQAGGKDAEIPGVW